MFTRKLALWSLVLTCGANVFAESVSIGTIKDNTLYQSLDGSISNGSGEHFFAGTTGGSELRRGLIAFDVAAAVPAGSVIDSATLTLNMSRTTSGSVPVGLHRVLANWGQGDSDALGFEGSGAEALVGDATWLHRSFNTTLWTQPGGDFDAAVRASTMVSNVGAYGWSSALLTADVQSWLDAPQDNFGWLVLGDESSGGTAKRFDSGDNLNPSVRPVLTIQYTVPEPATLCLLAIGFLAFLRFAARRNALEG